jgi:hypothetical protein
MENNDELPEDMSEEMLDMISKAYINFTGRFSDYIKEMDPELWARARAYAADYVDVPGVTLEIIDEDDVNDTDDNKHGAD